MDSFLAIALLITIIVAIILVSMIHNLSVYKNTDPAYYKENIFIYSFLLTATAYIAFSILRHFITY